MSLPLLAAGPPSPRPPGQSQSPPTLSSAVIGTNGTSLTLTFSEAVTGFASGAEGFALTGLSGGATTLTYASGNGTSSVVMTISRTVAQGETGGSLAYTAGDITASANGLALANFSGTGVTNNSTQTPPVNTVAPAVTGTEVKGQTLSCTTGTWTGTAPITYTYQWQRNDGGWANIDSATNSTYVLQDADVGYPVRCVVTGTNSVDSASANSNATGNIKAVPSTRNTTSGGLTASTAITLPTSSSGDIVAVMVAGSASLPAATAGWTRQWNTPTGTGGAPYLALYTCTSDGAPGTPLSANVTGGWIAWSVKDAAAVDVTNSAADSGVTQPIVAPSVTTTVGGTLLLNGYLGYKAASSPTITLPASQTGTDVGPVTITNGQLRGGSEEVTAAGATGTRSASVSTTVRWVGGSVAIRG